eukprot:2917357-Alexandrium_andersonii.AAC.1
MARADGPNANTAQQEDCCLVRCRPPRQLRLLAPQAHLEQLSTTPQAWLLDRVLVSCKVLPR